MSFDFGQKIEKNFNEITNESTSVFTAIWTKLTINNLFKYMLQGLAVAIAAYVIPNRNAKPREIFAISIIAALSFFVLDIFTSDIAYGSRIGIGFAIGHALANINPHVPYLVGIV
jgi:hypothetical protein